MEVWGFLDLCPVSLTKADLCSLAEPPLPYHSPFNSSSSPRQERRGLTTWTGRSGVGLLPVVRPDVAGTHVRWEPGGLRGRRPAGGQMDDTVDSVSESGENGEKVSGSSCVVWSNWIEYTLTKVWDSCLSEPVNVSQLSSSTSCVWAAAVMVRILHMYKMGKGEQLRNDQILADPSGLWKTNKSSSLSCWTC